MSAPRVFLASIALALSTSCSSDPGWFPDAAADSELEFISYSGDHLWYLIDTMGSGLAAGDYDGDGDADLYLASGHAILDAYQEEAAEHPDALWRNDGGRFTDVTAEAGLGVIGWSHGATFCDIDGDDDLDLYVTRHGPNLLYVNQGDGRFVEGAREAGVDHPGFGAGVAFADFDGDGDLDLYLANYARFSVTEQKDQVTWFTDGVEQFPQYFPEEDNVLYRNEGGGRFIDVTEEAGARASGRSLGVLATDFDLDGDIDVFVANDVGVNSLLENDGSGRFEEIALFAGVAYNDTGAFEASMGVAGADIDSDGDIDLLVTNYGAEQNTLYRNDGDGLFVDITREAGLVDQRILDCVGWGTGFSDFDNDGHLDLFVVNGHVVPDYIGFYMKHVNDPGGDIPQMRSDAYRGDAEQTKLLFFGDGQGHFVDATDEAGPGVTDPRMSRGAAFADFDLDGRVDIAVTNKNAPAQVLLNRVGRATGQWLRIALRAPAPNTRGVGARILVEAGGVTQTREVYAGSSYLSGNELPQHFGLGKAETADKVTVIWPAVRQETFARRETFGPLAAGKTWVLRRGEGSPEESDGLTDRPG